MEDFLPVEESVVLFGDEHHPSSAHGPVVFVGRPLTAQHRESLTASCLLTPFSSQPAKGQEHVPPQKSPTQKLLENKKGKSLSLSSQ